MKWNQFFERKDVVVLSAKIIKNMKEKPPKADPFGPLSLMAWMSRNLSKEDFELLELMEEIVGEELSVHWLYSVIDATHQVTMADAEEAQS